MTTLKFADTHNMVAFLAKPAESEGFEQIVDFLNAHTIKYALTINPTIYTSYIEQFWATVKAKTVNGEVQLQALVDGKKIIITYSKTTAWNEFSSTMASAIICLATNQKFNFSKYIFKSMVKNLDNVGKFLMYPRFVQVFVNQQLDGLPSHKRIYVTPSHTKKIFGNMKRVGKGFSVRFTPLFPTMVVYNQEEMGKGSAMPTDPHQAPTIIQPSTSQPQKTQKPRRPKRKDTKVPQPNGLTTNIADEAVNEEMDGSLVRAATIASSLEAKQDSGNIDKTQSKATPNELSSPGTSSSGGPTRQETMRDTIAQTRSENVSKLSNDPLLAREITKTTQANEIASLKKRVKKLEQKKRPSTYGLKRLYKVGSSRRVESSDEEGLGEEDASKQGRIADINANKDIYLVNVHTNEDMFGVNDLYGDEVIVDNVDVVKTTEETRSMVEEVTAVIKKAKLVSAAKETVNAAATSVSTASTIPLKSAKPKADKVVIQEPEQGTTTTTLSTTIATTTITAASTRPKVKWIVIHEHEQAPTLTVSLQQPSQVKVQDKGKGKMVEPEPVKKMSKKDLLRLDKELAFKLQAKEEEEEEAKIEADYQLAQRLQAQEQEELTDEEKARLFVQFLEQKRKHFAAKRAEEKRTIPPTRAQQRSIMCTYLKNMEGWKPKSLKNKSFANIQELFDKAMKRVNTFVDFRTELVKESSRRQKQS
ncbi:hypothetical protein Tco_0750294 [Tanacetum coccineum]|uniref:Xylulose kinase-1 n=1 Tax=Tanacetum coccineum TaxID=301880 RepID=A0ABQ4Z4F9_9ASTR